MRGHYRTDPFYRPPQQGEPDQCRVVFWFMQPSGGARDRYDVFQVDAVLDSGEPNGSIHPPSGQTPMAMRLEEKEAVDLLLTQEKTAEPYRIDTLHNWIYGVAPPVIWEHGQTTSRIVRVDPYFHCENISKHPLSREAASAQGRAQDGSMEALHTQASRKGLKLKPKSGTP